MSGNTDGFRSLVERATFRLRVKHNRLGGQAVIVPGNLVLTAAHCINWTSAGGMALGDHYLEEFETASGPVEAEVRAVEPVSDVAALGAPDGQTFFDACNRFEKLCGATRGVPLFTDSDALAVFERTLVWIRTHDKGWVRGEAQRCSLDASALYIEAEQQINGGTSGGPVVTGDGELIGVVSNFSEELDRQRSSGLVPLAHLCLPGWTVRQIISADREPEAEA